MYISIDMGGTNTRVASSSDLLNIHKIERFKSNKDLTTQRKLIKQAILSVTESRTIKGISFGVPGTLDHQKKVFVKVPSYKDLNGMPFSYLVDPYFRDIPLFTSNDASLATLAESMMGAGIDYDVVAYITLSTGVGGSLVNKQNKKSPFVGNFEPGHHIISQGGRYNDRCGQFGCLESYCSGTSFEEIYNVKPDNCIDEIIWDDYAKNLSMGIINIVSMWNPEVIVLGGKVSNKFNIFYPKLKSHLKKQRFFTIPPIVESELKDDSGICGGFIYLKISL